MNIMDHLPTDLGRAALIGRILTEAGPSPIAVIGENVFDCSGIAPTVSALLEPVNPGQGRGRSLGPVSEFDFASQPLLSPIDLQCIKAAGVTFAASMIERVIEERARGDASKATELRHTIETRIGAKLGGELGTVVPGSDTAFWLKDVLIAEGLWSQYLEVAIGPDAEIFTKAPVLASVGHSAEIGVRSDSHWNNPEPEIVLVCNSAGAIIGATLGNDVNLRDFEGRSALLLGKGKDNNASCAIGPFIRLFDEHFSLDDLLDAELSLTIRGEDGFYLEETGSMRAISRSPRELVRQTMSEHDYPDGFALFLGTMFAPTQDRDAPGMGFTHKEGDCVRISSARLGMLENRVTSSAKAPRWRFGITQLMANLAERGLLASPAPSPLSAI
ncbi:fumarylacetoacetate hydrolase family protein [Sphingomonas sp.]|uniref:fumarylacetoacetate hydrolase family protein n=1 Tax=Sphingomonas sp. TaxID=28214 RepID=UPI0025DA9510|nr:fumarylacetoacetate hydrolase family protein [Sphingomonas sp.]